MRPARQGDFDGLCGLYALINALDPAGCRMPRSPVHRKLFVALAAALPSRKLGKAIDEGLEGKALVKAAAVTLPMFKRGLGGLVTVSQPFPEATFRTNAEFVAAIADIMASGRSALVLNVSAPAYDHWTVAASITPLAITVRDSGALKELRLDRYTVRRGRYRIRPAETLLVHFKPRRPATQKTY
jgi:hypothetical protein